MPEEFAIDKAAMLRAANDSARLILKSLASKDAKATAMVAATELADKAAREAEAAARPVEEVVAIADDPVARNVAHLKTVMAQFDGMDTSLLRKAIDVADAKAALVEAETVEGAAK